MKTKEPKLRKTVQELNEHNRLIRVEKGINMDAEQYLKVILAKIKEETNGIRS